MEIMRDQEFSGSMTQERKKTVQFSDGAFLEFRSLKSEGGNDQRGRPLRFNKVETGLSKSKRDSCI